MNMYRIYFRFNGDISNFISKAETHHQAIDKWLKSMKETSTFDDRTIDLCKKY